MNRREQIRNSTVNILPPETQASNPDNPYSETSSEDRMRLLVRELAEAVAAKVLRRKGRAERR
jgi:hypothetical protein